MQRLVSSGASATSGPAGVDRTPPRRGPQATQGPVRGPPGARASEAPGESGCAYSATGTVAWRPRAGAIMNASESPGSRSRPGARRRRPRADSQAGTEVRRAAAAKTSASHWRRRGPGAPPPVAPLSCRSVRPAASPALPQAASASVRDPPGKQGHGTSGLPWSHVPPGLPPSKGRYHRPPRLATSPIVITLCITVILPAAPPGAAAGRPRASVSSVVTLVG
jgi:hypothetical protein